MQELSSSSNCTSNEEALLWVLFEIKNGVNTLQCWILRAVCLYTEALGMGANISDSDYFPTFMLGIEPETCMRFATALPTGLLRRSMHSVQCPMLL